MTQSNLEIIRRGYEAIARGDLDVVRDLATPDFELRGLPDSPISGEFRGPDAIPRWIEEFAEVATEVNYQPEEFIDAGDQVVVSVRMAARGRSSGIRTEQHIFQVWTLRGGKVTRLDSYRDEGEAREAAGLPEAT